MTHDMEDFDVEWHVRRWVTLW